MSLPRNIGSLLIILVLTVVGLVLGRVSYVAFKINGFQAEAKLMLSHLQNLQQAQYLESEEFQSFEELYGAPILGEDRCDQPQGASKLGFMLRWCHQETRVPLRFSYRSILTESGYRGEAFSGSDSWGASFVCFGHNEQSVWSIEENKVFSNVKQCLSYF